MYTQQFFIDGMACISYLVGCESAGVAAVIDPDRDVQKYLDAAERRGLAITHIIETHLHADHVSGNTELAARTGAGIYLHAGAQAGFEHLPLEQGQALWLGKIRLDVLATPGHTPDSISLLVSDTTRADDPWLALTGDTLFVGDIGRPDLVGVEAARQLASDMHTSLFKQLLPLEDSLLIYPGHGSGSLCGKAIGSMRSTTLGYERRSNPALQPRSREEFIEFATSNLPEQPGNHQRIKQINRRGPAVLGEVAPAGLTIKEAIPHFQRGAAMLDTRSKESYVALHVPGAVRIELTDQLSSQVGFILSPDYPLVLVLDNPADYREIVYQLARVGYEKVIGYLAEGLDVWQALGLPVTSGDIQDITPQDLHGLMTNGNGNRPLILDVREPWEYQQGHLPGAVLIPLGQLASRVKELDSKIPVAVVCHSGNRSQSGAAVLGQNQFKTIYNLLGGTSDWARQGLPLER